jgi:hypothetical protein
MKEYPMNHHEFVKKCSTILKDVPPEFHENLINYAYSFVDDSDEDILQRLTCLTSLIRQPLLEYTNRRLVEIQKQLQSLVDMKFLPSI